MVKELLLFTVIGFAGLSYMGNAGNGKEWQQNAIYDVYGDSTGTDSAITQALLLDPKKGFSNLFEAEAAAGKQMNRLHPMAVSFVEDYMDKHTRNLEALREKGKPYFDLMDGILEKHGLPIELKYLAVIESNLKSGAVSWAGAAGPWQFMPATARRMGLRVNSKIDERRDYYKSTNAAAKYLTELFNIYEDWLLVIAAYNGGPGKVNSAIRRSGSRDFWKLQHYLPTESKNHVKKFIATHYIMEGQGGITTLTREETDNLLFTATALNVSGPAQSQGLELRSVKTVTISGKYNSAVVAKHITMDITEFNKLNPGFDAQLSRTGNYDLRLSPEKMDLFLARKYEILNESMQFILQSAKM